MAHRALGSDSPTLAVHLPRTVTLKGSTVTLGQVCVVHGADADDTAARALLLGHLYSPDQRLTLTRQQILSRLVCSGIDASRVRITGAEKVMIHRSATTITSEEFIALAKDYLEKRLGAQHQAVITPLRKPQDLRLGEGQQRVQLVPCLVGRGRPSQVRVKVAAMIDGTEQASRDVLFRIQYPHRVAVTTDDLPADVTLTPAHFKIETELRDQPEPITWKPPVGLVTTHALPAGSPLTKHSINRPVVPVAIKRNEVVVIRIQHPGLTITTMGRALSDALTGEVIKVKNADSNRIIVCRVQEDGTVTPVL
jgi:flagella basal body P-ring formation protein FlgA